MSTSEDNIEISQKADDNVNMDMASDEKPMTPPMITTETVIPIQPIPIVTVTTIETTFVDPVDSVNNNQQVTTNRENNNGDVTMQSQPQSQQQQTQTSTMTTTTATSTASSSNKDKMDTDTGLINFKVLYILAQLCGLTVIVLIGSWIGVHLGGLGGADTPQLEFNWHPLLMTIGLIFLYGNGILVYRGFRSTRKKTLKIAHATVHVAAFILTVVALVTVFDSHNLAQPPIPNMYSLHSWLGLSAVILFCLQYVIGFVAFLAPGLKESYKALLMPLHVFFGLFTFVLAVACALMGLTEKAIFSVKNYSGLPSSGVMANLCGVLYVVFAGLVVYLTTTPSYKRKPVPEDTVLLTGSNE